jgi:TetR/AcrR family transcriptional repressor of nem operon
MRRSRSETVETKKRIVAAASRLFLDGGLDSVGMRDVMEAAELTAGGFYRHFSSKDQWSLRQCFSLSTVYLQC